MGLYLIADFSWASPESWLAILKVVVGLGTVIFVHELGHFLVAKWCGVKCEKFYVGFDFFDIKIAGRVIIPRSLIKYQWGETEYGIGIIPLGGYVKMLGQDDDPTKYAEEMERSKAQAEQEQDEAKKDASAAKSIDDETDSKETEQSVEGDPVLDPRSYQAKNVPQRMAIISAGVIMNLIFAVIFATIAYKLGVNNRRCVIGATVAGGPAYNVGLMPGDKIIQIDKNGTRSEFLRFRHDLFNSVILNGDKQPLDLLLRRRDGTEEWVQVTPWKQDGIPYPTIGIVSIGTTKLNSPKPVAELSPAANASEPFQANDLIVEVDGREISEYVELQEFWVQNPGGTHTYTVERVINDAGGTKRIKIEVGPRPARGLGLVMEMGEIQGIQPGSPAEKAGFKEGDVISKLNGNEVDGIMLPTQLRAIVKDASSDNFDVEFEVLRGGKTKSISVAPRLPTMPAFSYLMSSPYLCDELGIAYQISNKVRDVKPNSPAAASGIKPGDVVEVVGFELTPEFAKNAKYSGFQKPIKLDEHPQSWPLIDESLQAAPPGTKTKLTFSRGGKQQSVTLLATQSTQRFNANPGLIMMSDQPEHVAESWGEAASLGLRETKESALKVVFFLQKLVTGGISPTNLGGPLSIGVVATSEASESTSRLLIFLTLLSANLAVVNFLPIPVLDGGHMMFLGYELIFRRKPSERWFVGLSVAGLAFILSLMLFVLGLDVFHISKLLMSG